MQVQEWRTFIWRNPVGGVILYGALVVHIGLALHKVYQRYTLKMPLWEAIRSAPGLAIPVFLLSHIANTRFALEVFGVDDTYIYEFVKLWPNVGVDQTILLLLVWVHSCIGLHYWLRMKMWYRRTQSLWFMLAILIPTLSLLGSRLWTFHERVGHRGPPRAAHEVPLLFFTCLMADVREGGGIF